jgi:hypothetical protein
VDVSEVGHPLSPGPPAAVATDRGVSFAGGRIDALVICDGRVVRTAAPEQIRFGLAQVRRLCLGGPLRLLHVLFAPVRQRPLLLGLVRLQNGSDRLLGIDYSELWDVPSGTYRACVGACERQSADGIRALADAGSVLRARVPNAPAKRGLALDVALVLPPRSFRELHFAYAAPESGHTAAELVRGWRGDVAREIVRVSGIWQERVGRGPGAVAAYRRIVGPVAGP